MLTLREMDEWTRKHGNRGFSVFLSAQGWRANVRTHAGWVCGNQDHAALEDAIAELIAPEAPKPARRRRDLI